MKNNKFIILLICIILLLLIILTIIYFKSDNNKIPEEKNTTTTTTKVILIEEPLTNEEIIESLNIYAGEEYEFIITEENSLFKTVERKNKSTGESDMKFKVDTHTGIHEIEGIKPFDSSAIGGN